MNAEERSRITKLLERIRMARARMTEISAEETSIGRNYPGAYGFADSTLEWVIAELDSIARDAPPACGERSVIDVDPTRSG